MEKKGFIGEFKEFIMRGNVMDLAVGVIIGSAFQSIVKSLVDDIIMPVITKVTGGINFENWFIALDGKNYDSFKEAVAAKAATLNYGVFITNILQFLIMALVIFMLVKFMNRVADKTNALNIQKEEAEEAATTKECPYCKSEISIDATRCPHCTSILEESEDLETLDKK